LETSDFKVLAASSDGSTTADSDTDDAASSYGQGSEASFQTGPPGIFCSSQCAFVQPSFQVQAHPLEVQQVRAKPQQDVIQDGTLTSVMLRNIPNNLKRDALLELFDCVGFSLRLFDFVYLPIDFARKSNVGYCFVNLINAEAASSFQAAFQGFQGWTGSSQKVCEAVWSQPCQGLECHIERYRNSPVMHEDVPDDCRPMLFQDGTRVVFPMPTKPLRRPKMRTAPTKSGAKSPYWRQGQE
jgi:hypothetical protein